LTGNRHDRPPESIETAIHYFGSEALTDAIRYSQASTIAITVAGNETVLRAAVADDGVGGAEPGIGSGLIGLSDLVEALRTVRAQQPTWEGNDDLDRASDRRAGGAVDAVDAPSQART
jgi:signal transduction histidine kinase